MARRRKSSRPGWLERWRARRRERADQPRSPRIRAAVVGLFALVCVCAAVIGMRRMETDVRSAANREGPARIVFLDRPAQMAAVTEDALAAFADVPWAHPALCRDIADALFATGWVKSIESVHRFPDRRIEVDCTFRRPVAMVQAARGCCLVDHDAVRLPGWYTNDPGFKLIVGATEAPPSAGESWPGGSVKAAIDLVQLLAGEYFNDQITGVLIAPPRDTHAARPPELLLATDRAGARIIWGSPIGQEIEENTADQKLNLLRSNYRRFGRIDADRGLLDVSVHPDRVISPASAGGATEALAGR